MAASADTDSNMLARYPFGSLLFDSLPLGIVFQDAQARITTANPAAREILGLSLDQMRGVTSLDPRWCAVRSDGSPFPGEEHPAMLALATGKAVLNCEMAVFNPRLEVLTWLNVSAYPMKDESSGELLGVYVMFEDISERKRAQQMEKESEARFASLFSAMSEGMALHELVCDDSGQATDYRILEVNAAFERQTGLHRDAVLGRLASEAYGTVPFLGIYAKVAQTQEPASFESVLEALGRHFRITVFSPARDRFATVFEDISERKQVEEQLRLAANVFIHAREGIVITDADARVIAVNDAFASITGYARDEVIGRNPRILRSGLQEGEFYAKMWRALVEQGHWSGEISNRRKNGEVYVELLTISAVRDLEGKPRQYVGLFSDITPLKEQEKRLENIAHYDALTGLPNRVLLADRLQQSMVQAQRRGQPMAVVYLDLDGFKAVNDRHGHETGDQLLIAVATRMKLALREGDTLSRLGGDEFVAVLPDLADAAASVPMLARLLAAAAQPLPVGDLVLQVSASLGVTFFPQAEDIDADQLLRQADQAMYQAKLAGKNRYHVFDSDLDRSVRGHHESLERIRRALAENEFVLHYQPKVNMRSGEVIGVEALVRWQHPEKGLLAPALFLPLIEDHPLAVELGEWVIDSALGQIEEWLASGLNIPVSVNVGARQLQHPEFTDRLRRALAAHPGVRHGDLAMEVVETSALEDLLRVSRLIDTCREFGVTFALDDFGTGYSSLTYLKRLPVTQLKIDQSFVRGMLDDPDYRVILEGVIGLARSFRRDLIAEGVETAVHGTMLLQLGCELAQGYGIARPMPAQELPGWAANWRPDPAWSERTPGSVA
jgi:diguanylate cyclase (GGDEF)-like protein/PAS domain S-box-containing protein